MRKIDRVTAAKVIPSIVAGALAFLLLLLLGRRLQTLGGDLLARCLPAGPASDDIVIVDLREWPLPEKQLVSALAQIGDGQPRTVVLDILLDEGSTFGSSRELAAVCELLGNVVVPFRFVSSATGPVHGEPRLPSPLFAESCTGIGFVNAKLDDDLVLRRAPHVVTHGPIRYLSFSLEAARLFLGAGEVEVGLEGDHLDIGSEREFRLQNGVLPVAWTGGPKRFQMLALPDSRKAAEAGQLKDKLVLIGLANPDAALDWHVTPVGRLNGALVQANILNQLLTGRTWRSWPASMGWLLGAVSLAGAAFLALRFSPGTALGVTLALIVIAVLLTAALAAGAGQIVPILGIVVCAALGSVGGMIGRSRAELLRLAHARWPGELVAEVAEIVRLRADCNDALEKQGRKPVFKYRDDMFRQLPRCMRLVGNEDEFNRVVVALHWLLREGVDDDHWPEPACWPAGQGVIIKGEGQHEFIQKLSRIRNWGDAHIRKDKDKRKLGDIFAAWGLPAFVKRSDGANWAAAQRRLTTEARQYLESVHDGLAAAAAGTESCQDTDSDQGETANATPARKRGGEGAST